MPLRIRFQYVTGSNLGFAVERLADGLLLDQTDNTFKANPGQPVTPLTESASPRLGMYRATINTTPVAQYSNGNYAVSIHDLSTPSQNVIAMLMAQMISGDDNVIPSGGSGGSVDVAAVARGVWEFVTTSTSVTGTFGDLVKGNLDAKVSTRSTFAGGAVSSVTNPVTVAGSTLAKDVWDYAASSATVAGSLGFLVRDNLDAKVSTRSTFAGGAVSSVTNPVTVGVNQDKSGYSLSSAGLDLVMVESGINIRQAMAPILAASAGVIVSGANGLFTIRGGNSAMTRIQATADGTGNRANVILTLPS